MAQEEDEATVLDDAQLDALDAAFGEDGGMFGDELGMGDEFALLAAEDVVVSAARHAQPIEESAASITVLTRERILATGITEVPELLRLVPGVDVYRATRGLTLVGVRSGTSLAGDLLLVLVDGRDVGVHLFNLPQWNFLPFTVEEIERIEIVRGPGSTLYGANAVQGVINIVTRRPDDTPLRLELESGLGSSLIAESPPVLRPGLSLRAMGRTGPVGYLASIGLTIVAPDQDPSTPSMNYRRARVVTTYEASDTLNFELEGGVTDGFADIKTTLADARADNFWPYGRLRVRYTGWGETELSVFADENNFIFDHNLNDIMVVPEVSDAPVAYSRALAHPTRSGEFQIQHAHVLGDHRLTVGGSGRAIKHRPAPAEYSAIVHCEPQPDPDVFDPTLCSPSDPFELRGGVYVQDEWRILDNLIATGGLRLDRNSLTTELGVSPRLALVFRPTPTQAVRISAGRAYRKPTYLETNLRVLLLPQLEPDDPMFPSQELTRRIQQIFAYDVGNPDLVNEKMSSVDLGWRGKLEDLGLSYTLDAFLTRHDDLIEVNRSLEVQTFAGTPFIPAGTTILYENTEAPAYGFGTELSLTFRPLEWLDVRALYTFESGRREDRDGNMVWGTVGYEPPHTASLSVDARLPAGFTVRSDVFWTASFESTFRGVESLLDTAELGPSTGTPLWNVDVRYRLPKAWPLEGSLGLSMVNVLDLRITDFHSEILADGSIHGVEPIRRRMWLYTRLAW